LLKKKKKKKIAPGSFGTLPVFSSHLSSLILKVTFLFRRFLFLKLNAPKGC